MRRWWPVHSCRHSSHLKNQRKSLIYRKQLQQQQQQNQSSRKIERKVVPTAKICTPWLRSFCAGSWTLSCDLPSVIRMQIWKLKSHKFITLSAFLKKNACGMKWWLYRPSVHLAGMRSWTNYLQHIWDQRRCAYFPPCSWDSAQRWPAEFHSGSYWM